MDTDFLKFDGNPQTFRLLTRLQILNDDYGLNLTVGTLAALLKYPSVEGEEKKGGYGKFGVFKSERDIAAEVWEATGLEPGIRHPFAHVMEACDDMAYAVMDAEDTVKKGYASFYDLMDFLTTNGDEMSNDIAKKAREKNQEFKKEETLSSAELNEISMQMFRVFALHQMVEAVTVAFVENIDRLMARQSAQGFELIKESKASVFCESMKQFDLRYGFRNKTVLRLELEGSNYISDTMDMMWAAISEEDKIFGRYAMSRISENYQRVRDRSEMDCMYRNLQLLADSISGMTDKYLIEFHDDLAELYRASEK